MTLFNDIMPYFDEFIHVYGWNTSILWSPLKFWTPKNFTTANFRHPVSKSWLRHWHRRWLTLHSGADSCGSHGAFLAALFQGVEGLTLWLSPTTGRVLRFLALTRCQFSGYSSLELTENDKENMSCLTLSMLSLLLSKTPEHKDFWKPSKPCHVGILWIALAEYFQMSTHLPGFQSFFRVFASFCNGQISHQQHKG